MVCRQVGVTCAPQVPRIMPDVSRSLSWLGMWPDGQKGSGQPDPLNALLEGFKQELAHFLECFPSKTYSRGEERAASQKFALALVLLKPSEGLGSI